MSTRVWNCRSAKRKRGPDGSERAGEAQRVLVSRPPPRPGANVEPPSCGDRGDIGTPADRGSGRAVRSHSRKRSPIDQGRARRVNRRYLVLDLVPVFSAPKRISLDPSGAKAEPNPAGERRTVRHGVAPLPAFGPRGHSREPASSSVVLLARAFPERGSTSIRSTARGAPNSEK